MFFRETLFAWTYVFLSFCLFELFDKKKNKKNTSNAFLICVFKDLIHDSDLNAVDTRGILIFFFYVS